MQYLKNEIIEIFKNATSIKTSEKNIEISLPLYLDNGAKINLFLYLEKNNCVLYNNLYSTIEDSIFLKTKNKKDVVKEYLNNPKEFPEIKETLKKFGIDTSSLLLEFKIKNKKDISIEILMYAEFIKSYYNNLYNILIERLIKTRGKTNIYYNNFTKIVNTYKKNGGFKSIETEETLSNAPFYENKEILITASKDEKNLPNIYIDLLELKNKEKKGFVFLNKITKKKEGLLLKKFKEINIDLVNIDNGDNEIELQQKLNKEMEKIYGK